MGVLPGLLRSGVHPRQYRRGAVHAGARLAMLLAMGGAATPAPCVAVAAQEPPAAREVLPGARLAGQGRLTWWGLEVYDARLWVPPGFAAADFADHPFALELRYLRELRGAAIAQHSIDEMRRAGEF